MENLTERSLFEDFRLYNGRIRLGDATRPDLLVATRGWLDQANANFRKAGWTKAIAGLLTNDTDRVRDVLTEAQAAAVMV